MTETQMFTHPVAGPNNIGNCLVVYRDGRVHLALRRQEFLDGHATLATYESTLNSEEIGILQRLLQAPSIEKLQPPPSPVVPMTADEIGGFGAMISRDSELQKVGYVTWRGEGPRNSEAAKKAWRDAAIALRPLVAWFRAAKTYNSLHWRQVENLNSVCGE
jgi:hypothetical protein